MATAAAANHYLGAAFDTAKTEGLKNQLQIEHSGGLLVDKIKEYTTDGGIVLASRLNFAGLLSAGDNSALVFGGGTNALPLATSAANSNFLEIRAETTTTGAGSDTRAFYLRLYINGASTGGGEALRAFTTVEANIGTAHGAHISLNFLATAGASECSGQGMAVRGTLHIPNVASWAPTGTYGAGQFEIYSDGANSDPAGMTRLSVLELNNSGDATGKADVDTDACLFAINGWTAAADTTKCRSSKSLAELPANSIAFRVKVDGLVYWWTLVADAELN